MLTTHAVNPSTGVFRKPKVLESVDANHTQMWTPARGFSGNPKFWSSRTYHVPLAACLFPVVKGAFSNEYSKEINLREKEWISWQKYAQKQFCWSLVRCSLKTEGHKINSSSNAAASSQGKQYCYFYAFAFLTLTIAECLLYALEPFPSWWNFSLVTKLVQKP